jgi:adenylate cyclase
MNECQENPEKLEGETLLATVLIIDIRRFSSLLKLLSSQKVTILLNNFFDMVSSTVQPFGGVVFETTGDCAKVVFGAPIHIPNTEKIAIDAALALKKGVDDINRRSDALALPPIQVSIGIATGLSFCTAVGTMKFRQYSVLGEPVTESVHMENIAKIYGATIVACNRTKEAVKDQYHIRELDIVTKPEFPKPVTIYEIVASSSENYSHDMMSVLLSLT